jgi:signal transduction histidine kinase
MGYKCFAGRIGVPACSLAAKKAASHIFRASAFAQATTADKSLYRRGRLYAQACDSPDEKSYSLYSGFHLRQGYGGQVALQDAYTPMISPLHTKTIFLRIVLMLCCLFFQATAVAERSNAWTIVRQLVVNGKTIPLSETGTINLGPLVDRLQVDCDVTERAVRKGYRLQYFLEGVEQEWSQFNGNMTFYFRWKDEQQNLLELKGFPADGKSAGWTKNWKTAPLIPQCNRIVVPPLAHELEIQLTSGNGPVVGVYFVDDFKISVEKTGEVLFFDDFETETTLSTWESGGLKKEMAKIVSRQTEDSRENRFLAIFDDSASAYAVWSCVLPFNKQKHTGETLLVEWKQMYSIGRCSPGSFTFLNLPSGDWKLKMRRAHALTEEPIPNSDMDLSIEVPAVFWKRAWFVIACVVGLVVILSLASFITVRMKWKRQLAETEQQRMLEAERIRIARDIHDEIGHRLTLIGILAQNLSPETSQEVGQSIRKATQDTVLNMSEIVWAVNPKNDNLENLVGFLSRFMREFLKNTLIQTEFTVPVSIPQRSISADSRRQILMLLKETLNNSVKHAKADRISLTIIFQNGHMLMTISDNGVGFDIKNGASFAGNGLRNMTARVQSLGGKWAIVSELGKGTHINFEIPLGGHLA